MAPNRTLITHHYLIPVRSVLVNAGMRNVDLYIAMTEDYMTGRYSQGELARKYHYASQQNVADALMRVQKVSREARELDYLETRRAKHRHWAEVREAKARAPEPVPPKRKRGRPRLLEYSIC